ncbi:DUF305 domain-containing protein [Amycolatopsis australiensis]|uniref:Uncharacterized conserved protein, DUF305 family n=1 Tax=Amycolatopsis australiensis TaxID=546364 RepID=A0A1K1SF83_9PSEU|nr:DUF305 domain-containing protein [Amycolatopsis australiensis]SFW83035.1 Uncharacterized conserved protein, DUF305 family [Amycolatopsis australiensis]
MRRLFLGAVVALTMGGCATTVPAPGPASSFDPTDIAWLQLVVPMTENALAAARLAPDHAASASVRAAAGSIVAPSERLLVRLKAARDRAGLPATEVHSGHRMPGMVTPADLVALRTGDGPEFDRRLVALLRAHAAQLVVLAGGEQTSGADAETRGLAREAAAEATRQQQALATAA